MGASQVLALGMGGVAAVGILFALRWALRREDDARLRRILVLGLGAKLVGAIARYTIMGDLYGGRGDFNRYVENGRRLAGVIRSGQLPEQARETGTPFMDFLSGVLFAVAPAHVLVGFAVFSLLAYVGAYLFVQAAKLAAPGADLRRYAMLVMFLPTMVFWPSSLGKEAWLVFGLGLATYGGARVLARQRFGYLVLVLGTLATYQVRPHMGALFGLAFAGAFLVRARDRSIKQSAAGFLIGLIIAGTGAVVLIMNFGDRLPKDESVEGSTTDQIFAETDRRTSQGGSGFESRPVRNPVDFVHAAITVPFRPFPTEAHNRQAQLTSLEGVFLLGLFAVSLPRLSSVPRRILKQPMVTLAAAYSIGFITAFSNVGNFGILTRQRAQLLPFVALLLVLPVEQGHRAPAAPSRENIRFRRQPSPALVYLPPKGEQQGGDEPAT
ncbi:hypothetical protein [Egicoccus halophilus]|uniref:Uncharacterized protein n=1 Tax=Egicoccus halophilus TaxID=1670830 RepID=A0A8J3A797_9ACTN|nr:hypothetical protein [Egicoccus halophilus]GGI05338.1 hypothetical protein GCM10011354_13600 [Egicoccus halophilus]